MRVSMSSRPTCRQCAYGGPIYSVHALCRALAGRGHDIHVYTTNVDGPGNSNVPLAEPVVLDGVKVRYFPCGLGRRFIARPEWAVRSQSRSGDIRYPAPALGFPVAHARRGAGRAPGERALCARAARNARRQSHRTQNPAAEDRMDQYFRTRQCRGRGRHPRDVRAGTG